MSINIFSKISARNIYSFFSILSLRSSLWSLVFFLVFGIVAGPLSKTYAISDYDGLVTTSSNLIIYNPSHSPVDITSTFMSVMQNTCTSEYNRLVTALQDSNGKWVVTTQMYNGGTAQEGQSVRVSWTTDSSADVVFNTYNGHKSIYVPFSRSVYIDMMNNVPTCSWYDSNSQILIGGDAYSRNNNDIKLYEINYPVTYPTGYSDPSFPNGTNLDSDKDGINDNIESPSNPNRDSLFCDTSTSPYTCAYPNIAKKDIYVEVDWMNDGTRDFKPNSAQTALIANGLADNGYRVHIDVGQFGGGNEISDYVEYLPFAPNATSKNFQDLKNGNSSLSVPANFNPDRKGVWRYMISGYAYDESPTSSGASYAGSDNIFTSYGYIKDHASQFGYTNFDTAVAGTMIHEIGHSLCLSGDQSYSFQSTNCIYSGVDDYSSTTYDSVMNYNLQMFETHYSDGSNGTGDHDDWSAINNSGIADFSSWTLNEADYEPGVMHNGLTTEQAQIAKKKGLLGVLKKGDKIYDLRHKTVKDLSTGKVSSLK